MPLHDVDKFLSEVCKYVSYKGAHSSICTELQDHITDRIHDFIDGGMDEASAIKKAVASMGDPAEIGSRLNKLHRPYLGWFLSITNALIIFAGLFAAFFILPSIIMTFEFFNQMPKSEDIKYSINVNQKDSIDGRTVVIKEVVVDKNNTIYIRYNDYCTPFSLGWSMLDFKVYDDKGNTYYTGGGQSSGSIFGRRYLKHFTNFDEKATKVILDYDYFNRKMRFEIPIGGGGNSD